MQCIVCLLDDIKIIFQSEEPYFCNTCNTFYNKIQYGAMVIYVNLYIGAMVIYKILYWAVGPIW